MCHLLHHLEVHENQFPKYLHEPTFVAFHDVEAIEIGTQHLGDLEIQSSLLVLWLQMRRCQSFNIYISSEQNHNKNKTDVVTSFPIIYSSYISPAPC